MSENSYLPTSCLRCSQRQSAQPKAKEELYIYRWEAAIFVVKQCQEANLQQHSYETQIPSKYKAPFL